MTHSRTFLVSTLCSLAALGIVAAAVQSPARTPAELYVRTMPSGAEILLNGKPLGVSDGLFRVEPGSYRIVIDMEGRQPRERQITIRNGRITRIELDFKKPPQGAPPPSPASDADSVDADMATDVVIRQRRFVQLVVGENRITFEGHEATWEKLPTLLEEVPDRKDTVLCLAVASEEISPEQRDEARGRASRLAREYGFEYLSFVGVHPLGSKGDASQIIRKSPEGEITLPLAAVTTGARVRQLHFVQLVVGENRMTFEGRDTTWEELPTSLEQIPNRDRTVLCLAVASDEVSSKQKDEALASAGRLAQEYGFEYLSFVGVHPLGSTGGPSQTIQTASSDPSETHRPLRLEVGAADLILQGQVIQTWEQLAAAFERIADREQVEILIVAPPQLRHERLVEVIDRVSKLADQMGFRPCRVKVTRSSRRGGPVD
jgi:hypothetical protein